MNDKELAALIRKTTKAVAGKRGDTRHQDAEVKDLERIQKAKGAYVDIGGERDLLIEDAPPEDLFRIMAKREF